MESEISPVDVIVPPPNVPLDVIFPQPIVPTVMFGVFCNPSATVAEEALPVRVPSMLARIVDLASTNVISPELAPVAVVVANLNLSSDSS